MYCNIFYLSYTSAAQLQIYVVNALLLIKHSPDVLNNSLLLYMRWLENECLTPNVHYASVCDFS